MEELWNRCRLSQPATISGYLRPGLVSPPTRVELRNTKAIQQLIHTRLFAKKNTNSCYTVCREAVSGTIVIKGMYPLVEPFRLSVYVSLARVQIT